MRSSVNVFCDDISVEYGFSDAHIASNEIKSDRFVVTYVISDGVFIKDADSVRKIPSGTVIFFSQDANLSLFSENKTTYERYIISFSHNALISDAESSLKTLVSGCRKGYALLSVGRYNSSLDAIFDRFFDAVTFAEKERRAYLRALLSELFVLLSSSGKSLPAKLKTPLADRVARYINLNIQSELALEQIARRFFVSKFYLCRAFKQAKGCSIHSYIIECRLKYADELISLGETISSAAYKAGFSDYSTFYRAYVKKYGTPPSQKMR